MADTAQTNGDKAQGEALANMFLEHIKDQANSMVRYLKDLFDLSLDGRKAFRVTVSNQLAEQRKFVKEHEGTEQFESLKRTLNSYTVRLSEAVTVSKAFDAGFNPIWELDSTNKIVCQYNGQYHGYHSIVGLSRVFLQSQQHAGPTVQRGRKSAPAIEKAIAYLAKLDLTPLDAHKLATMLEEAAFATEEIKWDNLKEKAHETDASANDEQPQTLAA